MRGRNAIGTANVLQAAKAAGVQKLVYAASSTYYGNALPPHSESMLWMPSSPYTAPKYAAELLTTTYNHVYGLPTLISVSSWWEAATCLCARPPD